MNEASAARAVHALEEDQRRTLAHEDALYREMAQFVHGLRGRPESAPPNDEPTGAELLGRRLAAVRDRVDMAALAETDDLRAWAGVMDSMGLRKWARKPR